MVMLIMESNDNVNGNGDESREIEENGDNSRRGDNNVTGVKNGASIAYEMIRTKY